MKLKNIKLLSPQINRKIIKMAHQSLQQKNVDTVEKVEKSREMGLSKSTHLLSPLKTI